MSSYSNSKPPFAIIILDGLAHNPNFKGNAVAAAKKPNLDRLFAACPYTELITFGERVGLPDDQMGNSEVGHLNIGAGRVVEQDLLRINRAVRRKTLGELPALKEAVAKVKSNDTALHLLGLCSTGGVHSSIEHLLGIIEAALTLGCPRIFLHVITDGRDRPPTASLDEVRELDIKINQLRSDFPNQHLAIVDVVGRYYAMDRDKRWERTKLAYDLYLGTSRDAASFQDVISAIQARIEAGESDEFYKPCKIELPLGYRSAEMQNGDALCCFNFRADRMRQILSSLLGEKVQFNGFVPERSVNFSSIVTLTEYAADLPVEILFPPITIKNFFGQIISQAGLRQIRLAETEKYPHVTYFFNGGVEEPFLGEERILVPSPRDVPTYDKKPEMSAYGVTEILVDRLGGDAADIYVVNYANCDMVGHTGVFDAAVKAVETVDTCIGRVVDKLLSVGGTAIITADHGNADQMIDYETGEPHTFHTKYPVPLVIVGKLAQGRKLRSDGALCDIAPTACELLGLAKPPEMTGESLLLND